MLGAGWGREISARILRSGGSALRFGEGGGQGSENKEIAAAAAAAACLFLCLAPSLYLTLLLLQRLTGPV